MMAKAIGENTLFYGDNLPILREYIPDESVDLIYLDPPFNSNRSYNVLFKDESGSESESQITAFDDTWHWGPGTERLYKEMVEGGAESTARVIGALRGLIGPNQMGAYLDDDKGKPKRVLVQVKSGHVKSGDVRDLRGVVEREGAVMGILITLESPSEGMQREVALAGFYTSPGWNRDYPRMQLFTIEELLAGKRVEMPGKQVTFPSRTQTCRQAERVTPDGVNQQQLAME